MALINTLLTQYPVGNPIEIVYENDGTDTYAEIRLYVDAVQVYSGLYYFDANDIVYTDLQPLIEGYINNIPDITTTTEYTKTDPFSSAIPPTNEINVLIYSYTSGTPNLEENQTFWVLPEALKEYDWLKRLADNKTTKYNDAFSYQNGNNLLLNSMGRRPYAGYPIQIPLKGVDEITGSNDYVFSYLNFYTKWATTPINLEAILSTDFPNQGFTQGQNLFLRTVYAFPISGSQTASSRLNFTVVEYYDDVTYHIHPIITVNPDAGAWRELELPVQVYYERPTKFRVLIRLEQVTGVFEAFFNAFDWYFGNLNYNPHNPNISEITYAGYDPVNMIDYTSGKWQDKDFILNQFGQYYSNNEVTSGYPLATYLNSRTAKDTLRFAPLNVQVLADAVSISTNYLTNSIHFINSTAGTTKTESIRSTQAMADKEVDLININFSLSNYLSSYTDTEIYDTDYAKFNFKNFNYAANGYSASAFIQKYYRELLFHIVDPCEYKGNVYQLYYMNRFGGVDWIIMNGNNVESNDLERFSYEKNWRGGDANGLYGKLSTQFKINYNIGIETTYRLNTDIIDEATYNTLDDLVSSPFLWLYDAQQNETYAVNPIDTNYTFKQFKFDKMFNFQINVRRHLKNTR